MWEEGGVVAVELAPTLGGADVDPVGGWVAGARESVGVDKGLDQDGSVAVAGGPVVAETTGGERQELRGEVLRLDPGQDEKSGVVGDELEVGLALLAVSSASCRLRAPGLRSDLRANNSRSRIRSLASDASSLSFSTFSRLHARSCWVL